MFDKALAPTERPPDIRDGSRVGSTSHCSRIDTMNEQIPIGIDATGLRHETDSMGGSRFRPTAIGGADPARPGSFLDRRRPHAKAGLSRLRLRQEGGGAG